MSQMTLPKGSYECGRVNIHYHRLAWRQGDPWLMHSQNSCTVRCSAGLAPPKKDMTKAGVGSRNEVAPTVRARPLIWDYLTLIVARINVLIYFYTQFRVLPKFFKKCVQNHIEASLSRSGQARQDSSLWGMMLPACGLPTHHASGFRNWPRTQTLHHCFP